MLITPHQASSVDSCKRLQFPISPTRPPGLLMLNSIASSSSRAYYPSSSFFCGMLQTASVFHSLHRVSFSPSLGKLAYMCSSPLQLPPVVLITPYQDSSTYCCKRLRFPISPFDHLAYFCSTPLHPLPLVLITHQQASLMDSYNRPRFPIPSNRYHAHIALRTTWLTWVRPLCLSPE